jgi:hypothetical protein
MAVIDIKPKNVIATLPEIFAKWKRKKGANDQYKKGPEKSIRATGKDGRNPDDQTGDKGSS